MRRRSGSTVPDAAARGPRRPRRAAGSRRYHRPRARPRVRLLLARDRRRRPDATAVARRHDRGRRGDPRCRADRTLDRVLPPPPRSVAEDRDRRARDRGVRGVRAERRLVRAGPEHLDEPAREAARRGRGPAHAAGDLRRRGRGRARDGRGGDRRRLPQGRRDHRLARSAGRAGPGGVAGGVPAVRVRGPVPDHRCRRARRARPDRRRGHRPRVRRRRGRAPGPARARPGARRGGRWDDDLRGHAGHRVPRPGRHRARGARHAQRRGPGARDRAGRRGVPHGARRRCTASSCRCGR